MIYYLDTEVYINYFLLVAKPDDGGEPLIMEMLDDTITQYDFTGFDWGAHTFVTFNGTGYDLPIIAAFQKYKKNEPIKRISDDIIVRSWKYWDIYRFNSLREPCLNHIDISNVLPGMSGLKLYAGRINAPTLQDLPLDPSTRISSEQVNLMRQYCINDCAVTGLLFDKVRPQIALRERMGQQYGQDLRSKSDAQIAETVIASEYTRMTGEYPQPGQARLSYKYTPPDYVKFHTPVLCDTLASICDMEFRLKDSGHVAEPKGLSRIIEMPDGMQYKLGLGGLHSVDKPGSFYSDDNYVIYDIDVASYYPSLILNTGYAPENMGETFTNIYRSLVDTRLEAKRAGDSVTADALKITVNGSFGKLGSKYSKMYAPQLMMNVTLTGQLSLLMLIEELPGDVISANTDGVMVRFNRGWIGNIRARVSEWERTTGLVMEWSEYRSVHRRDVNNYLAITHDGKVKTKGVFAPTGLNKNPAFPIIQQAVIHHFLYNKDIAESIRECTDIAQFICLRTVKGGAVYNGELLGKAVRWYRSWLSASAIHYASNGNKVATSDCAVPVMVLPDVLPMDIDYEWYINCAKEIVEVLNA